FPANPPAQRRISANAILASAILSKRGPRGGRLRRGKLGGDDEAGKGLVMDGQDDKASLGGPWIAYMRSCQRWSNRGS
ncbi:MAG: hypothetical protein UHS51_07995, partial [Atopobiaceae bacterium]|nr:hypothetical protein [Atopobiaceae bacterium]